MRCLVVVVCVAVVVVSAVVTSAVPSTPDNLRPLINHQVWEVSGADGGGVVMGLAQSGVVDILGHTADSHTLRVAPTHAALVKAALRAAGLTHTITVHDLAAFLQKEEHLVHKRSTRAQVCTPDNCREPYADHYMKFDEMESYLRYIAKSPRTKVRSIGKSAEGRDIWLVHIKPIRGRAGKARVGEGKIKRKAMWIEGGIHAREWISSATAFHLIHNFLKQPSPTFDVYIVPMANPDGYVYTWTNDRLWRKNRGKTEGSCAGVDLNRNWDAHWGVGASGNPCSEVYMGSRAFSEPETRALKKEMESLNRNKKFDLVLSLHSYGQVILYPYGWTRTPAPDQPEMQRVGDIFAKAIQQKSGESYKAVNSAAGFYLASGATDDWAKEALGTRHVYTVELRDKGRYGFTLPADQIEPTAMEIWNALDAVLAVL